MPNDHRIDEYILPNFYVKYLFVDHFIFFFLKKMFSFLLQFGISNNNNDIMILIIYQKLPQKINL